MSEYKLVFSPAGGTARVADCLAETLCPQAQTVDLCNPAAPLPPQMGPRDLCLVAVPVYGGRVPAPAAARLRQLRGGAARAVLVAVYGNRAYEDALIELADLLTATGFVCVAGVAAIAQHSIVTQYAAGRPDEEDRRQLTLFARAIQKTLTRDTAPILPELPGDRPYRVYNGVPLKPKVNERLCTGCGQCAAGCPVGAIDPAHPTATDTEKCITCMRCIVRCPQSARRVSRTLVAATAQKLKKACAQRKPNELFL